MVEFIATVMAVDIFLYFGVLVLCISFTKAGIWVVKTGEARIRSAAWPQPRALHFYALQRYH